jgi:tyrosine-specific transport protein
VQKQIGATLLVAGTCIGSGMVALPMVLAKLGIIPSILIMLVTWGIVYYTALFSVELNLHSEKGLSLGAMGRKFSGKYAEILGNSSVKLLSCALLSVYISGESSVIEKLLETHSISCAPGIISATLAAVMLLLLQVPTHIVDKINRLMFLLLTVVFTVMLSAMVMSLDFSKMPLVADPSWKNISSILSVVFTSFGFQVIFHILRDYLGKDAGRLKKAFLWGSLIPAVIYILWTCGVLSVLYSSNEGFYMQMVNGHADVGDVIKELGQISGLPNLQILVWWLSISAIFTSIIGVGTGLAGSFDLMLEKVVKTSHARKIVSAVITVVPAWLVAAAIPNAFIKVFKFAGALLAIIAVLLPIYLVYNAKFEKFYYPEVNNKLLLVMSVLFGLLIMLIEFVGI